MKTVRIEDSTESNKKKRHSRKTVRKRINAIWPWHILIYKTFFFAHTRMRTNCRLSFYWWVCDKLPLPLSLVLVYAFRLGFDGFFLCPVLLFFFHICCKLILINWRNRHRQKYRTKITVISEWMNWEKKIHSPWIGTTKISTLFQFKIKKKWNFDRSSIILLRAWHIQW